MRPAALVMDYGGVLTDTDDSTAEPPLVTVLRRARAGGLRTALLSNADGRAADAEGELFDVAVFSGEVGISKPDPRIYRLAADRLGVAADACVFVDDLAVNVRGAAAAGMIGVHHTSVTDTVAELEVLFGLGLG